MISTYERRGFCQAIRCRDNWKDMASELEKLGKVGKREREKERRKGRRKERKRKKKKKKSISNSKPSRNTGDSVPSHGEQETG